MSTVSSGLPDEVITCLQNARFVSLFNVLLLRIVVILLIPSWSGHAFGHPLLNAWASLEGGWVSYLGIP